jgi:hypothetical protein
MEPLAGHFILEQLCCPSCGVLLNSDFIAHTDAIVKADKE